MSSFENRHIFSGRAVYRYKGHAVGEYFADLLVEDVLVIELKCVERLANEHIAH
jgi:GxxExxY protein